MTISGGTHPQYGLIGQLDGTVSNLGVSGVSISVPSQSGAIWIGGLVGQNQGTVQTSWSTGTVVSGTGFDGVGGLVGLNNGTVQASFSGAAAFGQNAAGGLVGANQATVLNSYATGPSAAFEAGGLIGENFGTVS